MMRAVSPSCPFCQIAAGAAPAERVLVEDALLAFLDRSPLQKGHLLVVPRAHVPTLLELPAPQLGPFFAAVQRLARAVETGLGAEGSFVAANTKVSQSVPHLHVHVVPRKKGDGLRGFFWPRLKYASDAERADYARRLRDAL
jgi:histidine triad (HIT) family protein